MSVPTQRKPKYRCWVTSAGTDGGAALLSRVVSLRPTSKCLSRHSSWDTWTIGERLHVSAGGYYCPSRGIDGYACSDLRGAARLAVGAATAVAVGVAVTTAAEGTAAATAGTTAIASGGVNVGEVGGKAAFTTTTSFAKKLLYSFRKQSDSDDEDENEAKALITETSVADSIYEALRALLIAEDDSSASGMSASVK
ncbi:hypothetical protein LSAT2_032321 [Lamellibrachia satsuma]|nr:hypothetical protein LSAT2_032321 [Lamellibrachia satsuma]